MKTLERIDNWAHHHNYVLPEILRIVLGAILLWKGIEFGRNQKDIQLLIDNGPFNFISLIVIQYIVMAHIAGGFLILVGLVTRVAVLFQLPLLAGAIIFMPTTTALSFYTNETIVVFVFLLLVTFLVYGSGKFSADEYLQKHPNG